jgi:ribonuclease T1
MSWTRSAGLLTLVCVALVVIACAAGPRSVAQGSSATAGGSTDPTSGLPIVRLADLPPQAAEVVALIYADGPFPNPQDGATFQNRERLLPSRPKGYYREYTVPTPGSPDRGARRIVTGADGEMYWTADHYDSFAWIAL